MAHQGSAPGRPDRRARTRAAILEAGQALFADRVAESVAIDDIVAEAGVSKGSFYNHFADREALVGAIVEDIRTELERTVTAANRGIDDPAQRLIRGVCVYLRYALDHPRRAAALARTLGGRTQIDSPLNRGLVEDIAAGLAEGRLVVASLESAVLFVLGVAQVGLLRITREPAPAFATVLAQQLCELVLRACGLTKGEAETLSAQAADAIVRPHPDAAGAHVAPNPRTA